MERVPRFMDQQNQYCENGYTTESKLQTDENSNDIIYRNGKINPEIHMEAQKTPNSQSNSEQKSNAGGITIPNFKVYYRAKGKKTIWYLNRNRQVDQWYRIQNPEINTNSYSHLIFHKVANIEGKTAS
jgi:hypothetical protein